nr:MATE family efflux transporter [uncultured Blautia sp.]
MKRNVDLLEGPIAGSMARLAFPIMGTSLIQMAYNMVDMIWIGRVSSNAVAAVGAAGMYMWLANGITTIPRIGGQVTVGQSLGAMDKDAAIDYVRASLRMGTLLGIIYGIICVLFAGPLIGFFKLNSPEVINDAEIYLVITCGAIVFSFLNQVFTGILTAMGNTMAAFRATTIGLIINLVLDPVLIFGFGPIPRMGVTGAALATVFAQIIVFALYIATVWSEPVIFQHIHLTQRAEKQHVRDIVRIGFPPAVQDALFSGISMVIARLIAGWGDAAVAVQKVGSQIESISWMAAGGFSTAVNAFVAQNYGAGKKDRIKKGYKTAMGIMALWGIFTSFILIAFPEFFFRIFITEKDVLPMGVDYLRIIGISEFFMCMEITTAGAFQGFGKTVPPSVTGIVFNTLRIPGAMLLSSTVLGLNGVWWTLSLSCVLKGLVLPVWFLIIFVKYYKSGRKEF